MTQIPLAVAQQNLAELVEATGRGEEIVITVDDLPVAKLVPPEPSPSGLNTSGFGSLRGLITISEDFDAPLEDFEPYLR